MLCITAVALGACPAACLPAAAAQTPPRQSAPYTLRYHFAAGQIRNYNCTVSVAGTVGAGAQAQMIAQEIDMLVSQTVQSVDAGGAATVLSRIVSAQSDEGGQPRQYSDAQVDRMQPPGPVVISPTGIVSGSAVDSANDPTGYLRLGQAQAFPQGPVALESSWRSRLQAIGLTLSIRSTLAGVSETADAQIARIATRYYGATGTDGMAVAGAPGRLYLLTTGTGTDRFNLTTGTLERMQSTLNTTATMAPPTQPHPRKPADAPITTHLTVTIRMTLLGRSAGS